MQDTAIATLAQDRARNAGAGTILIKAGTKTRTRNIENASRTWGIQPGGICQPSGKDAPRRWRRKASISDLLTTVNMAWLTV